MNNIGLISVIIPVYNMEDYLCRCLDSVCNNTYKNLEIICINDGSTDKSLEILKKYQKNDERIIIIDQSNQKLSAARNAGLDIATGEWIALIDSDDWVHPQYFELLINAAVKEKADICVCDSTVTSTDSVEYSLYNFDDIEYRPITKAELNQMHVARSRVWAKLYRKETIGENRFFSGAEPIEDNCFNTALYSTKMRYCYVYAKLYYYFMRSASAIHSATGRKNLVYTKFMFPVLAKESDPEKKQDIVKRCYNVLFASRYLEMYSNDFAEIETKIKSDFSTLKKYRKYMTVKDRIIYWLFESNPWLYRAWRIHGDPTLLEYEKKLKIASNK